MRSITKMEKIMLAIGKFKEGEGHFEKFMGFMQSEEGMEERRKVAHGLLIKHVNFKPYSTLIW